MSPRPELSKPMTSVTAAASTSRKLTRTTTSPSHWLKSKRRNPMRNERVADQSAPSGLTTLLATELPPFRLALIVEAGSLGYRRGGLFLPPEDALRVLSGAQWGIVVKSAPQLGEESVVVDISWRQVGQPRHGELLSALARAARVDRVARRVQLPGFGRQIDDDLAGVNRLNGLGL